MKLRLFFGGLLIGGAVGLMVGGAVVEISGDGGGERTYPQGLALLLALVGGVGAGSALRRSGPLQSHLAGNASGNSASVAEPGAAADPA
jgi:hypothetical protein